MPDLERLQVAAGYRFSDRALLVRALTHRGAANAYPDSDLPDNERLEFLGDAVIAFLAASTLYSRHLEAPEGDLTILRAKMVGKGGLGNAARRVGLGEYVILAPGLERNGGRQLTSLLANAFEALVGAVYLDGGLDAARSVFLRFADQDGSTEEDAKSRLAHLTQASGGPAPTYRLVGSELDGGVPVHAVEVLLGKAVIATARGPNRRTAEQLGAQLALDAEAAWADELPRGRGARPQDVGSD